MAQYKHGAVDVISGSVVVTGTDTAWLINAQPGNSFVVQGVAQVYDIASVDSDTQLTLTAPWQGASLDGVQYAIQRDFTTDGIPEMAQGDIETAAIFTRAMRRIQALIERRSGVAASGAEIYPTTEKGLLGTEDGEYFWVAGAHGLDLQQNQGGAAVFVDSYPTGATLSERLALAEQQAKAYADDAAESAQQAEEAVDAIPEKITVIIKDSLRQQVEAATGGLCTVIYTDKGQPSYFRVIPRFNCEDVAPGGELGTGTHEAFIRNGVAVPEILVGMYLMSTVAGEGVSQPRATPQWSISYTNAQARIRACGAGFDMMSCWDWAAVVLWTMANGYEMAGNTNFGRHHNNRWETGTRVDGGTPGDATNASAGQTLTGSGPLAWRHDRSPAGIADMIGNIWEWQAGFKMVDGRIFYSPDNGDHDESAWLDSGFDMPTSRSWSSINASSAPELIKRALIVPSGATALPGNYYGNLEGERLPVRGGGRSNGANAGPAALNLNYARSYASASIGARPRFRNQ